VKIAIPVSDGMLFAHFGHCPAFALVDTDDKTGQIVARTQVTAPPHEPGLLPVWLAEHGVDMVMAGGMGPRAQDLLAQKGIKVVTGVPGETPESLVTAYYAGTLATGANACNHGSD
jgi:ATP-binding protein involved in chromosome partitioning